LATAGDADAQFNMGQASKLGRGVPVDLPVALEWYRKAAVQGHPRAEDNYGLLLFSQGRRTEAMPYVRRAADRGTPLAQYYLATALYNGDLAPRDWVRAYALMTRAASNGLPQASNSLATMDQYIPEDQRKKGLALATQMASAQQAPQGLSLISAGLPGATNTPRPDPEYTPTPRPVPAPVAQAPKPAPKPEVAPLPPKPASPPMATKPASSTTPASPAATGNWRIQLGAFSADDAAKKLWNNLKGKVARLGSYQPYLVKAGNVTRLQAGPLASQADADRLCASVKAAGADCMIKKP
jgi:cell division septation protein DedD